MKLTTIATGDVCALPQPIAIDGPAASGKSSVGEALADARGYAFLDTGLMYRAFALAALRAGVHASDAEACEELVQTAPLSVEAGARTRVFLDGEDVTARVREPDVEGSVSAFSALPGVREVIVRRQREIAARAPSVLAGRDIGTVVLPDAPLKFYLQASEDARAQRRSGQAASWGREQHAEAARADIAGRDRQDSTRASSPLAPAADAIVIDTTALTLAEVIAAVMEHIGCEPADARAMRQQG